MTNVIDTLSVVVVTYGDRWQYLCRVLDLLEQDIYVSKVIVIDNASKYCVADYCNKHLFRKIFVYRNKSNLGSSGGFSKGISLACEDNPSLIMLLDDDNLPRPDSIKGLTETYKRLAENDIYKSYIVLAFREVLHHKFRLPIKPMFMHRKDFLCFNVFNAFQRYFKLTKVESNPQSGPEYAEFSGGVAYSGMLFSPGMVSVVGLPETDFVLYFDDFEYSLRMLKAGYTIWLDRQNAVDDLIENYSASAYKTPFLGFLLANSDNKIYYNIRNRVYLDHFVDHKVSVPYVVNKIIFLLIFVLLCLLTLRFKRLKTVIDACHDGQNGHLGLSSGYRI